MKVTLLSGNALYGMVENAVLGALKCTGNEKHYSDRKSVV